jgi:hypothetical protein
MVRFSAWDSRHSAVYSSLERVRVSVPQLQIRLADAGRAVDGGDDDGGRAGCQEGVELVEVGNAPGEADEVGGQLSRHDAGARARWPPGRRAPRDRLAAQDLLVYGLQFRAGSGTEFVLQPRPHVGGPLEGLGAATGGVQRTHERGGEGLVEGVLVGEFGEQAAGRTAVPGGESRAGPGQYGVEVLPRPGDAGPLGPAAGQVGQRLARWQVQGLAQQRSPLVVGVSRVAGLADQAAEPVQVDLVGVDVEEVPTGPADESRRPVAVGVGLVEDLAGRLRRRGPR